MEKLPRRGAHVNLVLDRTLDFGCLVRRAPTTILRRELGDDRGEQSRIEHVVDHDVRKGSRAAIGVHLVSEDRFHLPPRQDRESRKPGAFPAPTKPLEHPAASNHESAPPNPRPRAIYLADGPAIMSTRLPFRSLPRSTTVTGSKPPSSRRSMMSSRTSHLAWSYIPAFGLVRGSSSNRL